MIPLIEDYLKDSLSARLQFLRKHPEYLDKIFGTLGKRSTLSSLKDYFVKKDIKVVIGYPREANQLPCFVITLAGEQEVYTGLGDNTDEDIFYDEDEDEFKAPEENLEYTNELSLDSTNMEATYRIECWSDNGDLTAYMYTLAKYALLVTRTEMISNDILLPKISAADLEPVPDYFPIFVYRRALMISFQYENQYFENIIDLEEYESEHPGGDPYNPDDPDDPSGKHHLGIKEIRYIPHYYESD
jgi:hypothetical protein